MKLFVLFLFYFCQAFEAKKYNNLTRIGYAGALVMFRVPRERVEKKVEEYNFLYSCDRSKCLSSHFVSDNFACRNLVYFRAS